MFFTHFYLCQEKKINLACISRKQVINCEICFFIGVAIKFAVLVSWRSTSVSLC